VSQLWLEKSHVLEFSQKTCWYRLTEKSWLHLPKLWLHLWIDFGLIIFFYQTFFSLFSKWKFFEFLYFWTYQVDVYSFGIDFCQIWYVFNLLKQVLGPFFMVLDLFFHFYFWTRNGSKMGFRPLVFNPRNTSAFLNSETRFGTLFPRFKMRKMGIFGYHFKKILEPS